MLSPCCGVNNGVCDDAVTETNHPCAAGYASWDGTKKTKVSGCDATSTAGHCTAGGMWTCKGLAEIYAYGSPFAACSDAQLGEGHLTRTENTLFLKEVELSELSEKKYTKLFLSDCCDPGKGVCGDSAAVAGTALVLATLALAAML